MNISSLSDDLDVAIKICILVLIVVIIVLIIISWNNLINLFEPSKQISGEGDIISQLNNFIKKLFGG